MMDLLIETSGEIGYLALINEGRVVASTEITPPKRQSQELLPTLDAMLKKQNITLKELQAIAIGIGPGAFTGTRIGAMVAKSLAFTLNLPLIPFCSLEGAAPKPDSAVVTDAKAGYLYLLQDTEARLILPEKLPKDRPLFTPDPLLAKRYNLSLHPFSPKQIAPLLAQKKRINHDQLELTYLRKL